MRKTDAVKAFKADILPNLTHKDKTAVRCAWGDYTDSLCKDGQITQHQYDTWSNPFG